MSTVTRKFHCQECEKVNHQLADSILKLSDEAILKKTHLFEGRYENIYVQRDDLPGLNTILEKAVALAAEYSNAKVEDLTIGFWINLMNEGDITSLHSHDDLDEMVSGVYYVQVPEGSGEFICYEADKEFHVTPEEGCFVIFSPSLPHEVTKHENKIPRISIGFNVGPADSEFDIFRG